MPNTYPKPGDGTVLVTRPGSAQQHRRIHVRYGGRSAVTVLLVIASIALTSLSMPSWALLAMTGAAGMIAGTAIKYQRDLKWVTGYTDKPENEN